MPRNGSGTMSIPNSFTSGTTISSSSVNANFTDIASEITGSLPRDGQAAMTGQLKAANGSAAAPAISFSSDTNTGLYRKAADTIGLVANGAEVVEFSTTGVSITGTLTFTGFGNGTVGAPAITFASDTDTGLYRIGANNLGIAANGAKVVDVATTGVSVTGTLASSGALTVTAGGATVTAGGLTVTAGGLTVTAGSVSLPSASVASAALVEPAGFIMLQSQSASSSSSIDFTTNLSDTYDQYMLVMSGVYMSGDDVDLWLRIGTGGTPTWQASGYSYSFVGGRPAVGGGAISDSQTSTSQIALSGLNFGAGSGIGNATGESFNGVVWFANPELTSHFAKFRYQTDYDAAASNGTAHITGSGRYNSTGAITGVRILPSSGTISSGRFVLYGLKK